MESDWISIANKPPDIGQDVLVYYGSFIGDLMYVYTYLGDGIWEDEYGYWQKDEPITHWMPLPKPPKEEENNESI